MLSGCSAPGPAADSAGGKLISAKVSTLFMQRNFTFKTKAAGLWFDSSAGAAGLFTM